jgi:hypothetical protein
MRSKDSPLHADPIKVPGSSTAVLPVGLESMLESARDREVRPLTDDASIPASDELLPPLREEGGGQAGEPPPAVAPRPFPPVLETSDVWTEETIPYLR